jgi:hypothetical protein
MFFPHSSPRIIGSYRGGNYSDAGGSLLGLLHQNGTYDY